MHKKAEMSPEEYARIAAMLKGSGTTGLVGAGMYGLGRVANSPMLGALGGGMMGGAVGNVGGALGGAFGGGSADAAGLGALGGGIGGLGIGAYKGYQSVKNQQPEKQAMLDDIYNMGLDAAIDQFTKSAGIKRRIGKTYRRIIGKPSMRDRVENGVDAVRDRVSGPINSAKNLGSSAVNAIKKTWNDYSNKGEE